MLNNARINEIVGNEPRKMARTAEQIQDRQFGVLSDEDDTILHVLKAPNSKRQEAVLKYLQKRKERTFEKKVNRQYFDSSLSLSITAMALGSLNRILKL